MPLVCCKTVTLSIADAREMTGQKTIGRLLLFALLLCAMCSGAWASTVAVGTCTSLPFYTSIQTAVNSVPAGSTVKVCPGTYAEQVSITKNLTLTGVSSNGSSGTSGFGADNPIIVSPAGGVQVNAHDLFDGSDIAAQVVVTSPSNTITHPISVSISNIIVDGSNNQVGGCGPDLVGIYYQNAGGTVNHVVARFQELGPGLGGCQAGLAIFAQSGYGTGGSATVTIENSSVHDYQKNGITADGSATTATITGNYVVGQGATPAIAQNGIQVSDGASGKVSSNTVTDDVYVNPSDCGSTNSCFSASGILLYDSGGTIAKALTVNGNVVSNTQGGIVAFGDSQGTADYNTVTSNKVTTSLAAGVFLIDGIDLCSNNNTATSNTVYNSSGAGIHLDSQCTESTGTSGNNSSALNNTVNEACAGVLLGNGTGTSQSNTAVYNVGQVVLAGDSCSVGTSKVAKVRLKPAPFRHQ